MTELIFERRLGVFELRHVRGTGREIEVRLCEPKDGVMMIGTRRVEIRAGAGMGDLGKLSDGVYEPVMIYDKGREKCGKILVIPGGVSQNEPDAEYVRLLSDNVEELSQSVARLDTEIREMKEKIYGKSIF